MDLNHENAGFNRRLDETFAGFVKRLMLENDFINKSKDYALPEFLAHGIQHNNAKYPTCEETYYFNVSTGERKALFCDAAEVFHEPKESSKLACGFDINLQQNLKMHGDTTRAKKRT